MKRIVLALMFSFACGPGVPGGPTMNNKMAHAPETNGETSPVVSADIMGREPISNTAQVKHILIGWKELADQYQGRIDQRAAKRTKAEAETEVKSLLGQLKAGTDFDTVMKANSEDMGSAMSGRPFTVTPDAQLVIEFRQLSLRLKIGEVGVCESDYGFHIIKRLE
jgi:hypothetical protein